MQKAGRCELLVSSSALPLYSSLLITLAGLCLPFLACVPLNGQYKVIATMVIRPLDDPTYCV